MPGHQYCVAKANKTDGFPNKTARRQLWEGCCSYSLFSLGRGSDFYVCVCVCVCVCTYACTHIHKHMHTYMCAPM